MPLGYRRLAVSLMLGLMGMVAAPAQKNQAMSSTMLFELTKPATVMIQTNYTIKIMVADPKLDDDAFGVLLEKMARMVAAGQLPQNEQAIVRAVIDELASNPLTYLVPMQSSRTKTTHLTAIGSGFIVTEDGYVVTNAHVVAAGEDELKEQLASQALTEIVNQDAKDILKEIDAEVPQELAQKLKQGLVVFYLNNMAIGDLSKEVFVAMGVTVPGVAISQKGLAAEIEEVGAPVPGKDVALLKVQGENLPTLPIAADELEVGAPLYVIGYPAAATFHPLIAAESQIEPTLTKGQVSSKKKSVKGGWPVYQTDATMTHGNSGGPVLNEQGEVVGLATFGTIDPSTGQEIAGLNFVVPTSVVQEFLKKGNVTPAEGTVSGLWKKALGEYYKKHYKTSLKTLNQLNDIAPGMPYIQQFKSSAQKEIAAGNDRSSAGLIKLLIIAAVGVIGLVFLLGLLMLLTRRRRPKTPPAAPAV